MKKILKINLLSLFFGFGFAEAKALESCLNIPENPPTGLECVTSQGVVFKRVEVPSLGWQVQAKSRTTIWLDPTRWTETQQEAKEYCEKLGFLLPSREDFLELRSYFEMDRRYPEYTQLGSLESCRLFECKTITQQWLWSRTLGDFYYFGFHLPTGYIDDWHRGRSYHYSAKCILVVGPHSFSN